MKATKNGWTVEGDPREIIALINGLEPKEKKTIDWAKAQALKKAGWNTAEIAEELHTTAAVIGRRLK